VLEQLNNTIESLQKQLQEEQKERQRSEELRNLRDRFDKLKWAEDTTDFFEGKKCVIM
jgi:hypothetical protein